MFTALFIIPLSR